MATYAFDKTQLPLWKGGAGSIKVELDVPSASAQLTPQNSVLLKAGFDVSGSDKLSFGRQGSLALGIKASTKALLNAIWPGGADQSFLADHGLGDFFARHPDSVILALQLGASADLNAAVPASYAELTLQATLDTGADSGYTLIRAYPAATPVGELLLDFFRKLHLPGDISGAFPAGSVIAFEYGGYLSLGATMSVGYEIKGTPSVELGRLALSEHYQFSALGNVGAHAKVAGRYAVEVRGIEAPSGADGHWVEVIVRRARSREIGVAADVKVEVQNRLDGLPGASDEFLGAMFGVNTKNWFNYLTTVARAKTFEEVKNTTDALARHYLGQVVGKGFQEIEADVEPVLDKVRTIVDAYNQIESRALNLFDKYFDRIDTTLTAMLDRVSKLDSWEALTAGLIDPDLADVIGALTDSDPRKPLSWIAAMAGIGGIGELKNRAETMLRQVKAGLHQQIVQPIAIAKQQFGVDKLFQELARFDTPEKLLNEVNTLAGGFASRIVGEALTSAAKARELEKPLEIIKKVLAARNRFQDRLYGIFVEAANSRFQSGLHAEYANASEDKALVNALLNIDKAPRLLEAAGHGDYTALLTTQDPSIVRIKEGLLSHHAARKSCFTVNIMGWHDGFQYTGLGLDQVAVNADQHIKTAANGTLTVNTKFDLSVERKRQTGLRRSEECIYTNFLVQFLGESGGALKFSDRSHQYLVDTIRAIGASYQISFGGNRTGPDMLDYYLTFAQQLNLLKHGVTPQQVARLLPTENGNYGKVTADYDIEYTARGLEAMFSSDIREIQIRSIMRHMVLANYVVLGGWMESLGWCYWSDPIYNLWKSGQAAFTNHTGGMEFHPIKPAPFLPVPTPPKATLTREQLFQLSTLYYIEDDVVSALFALRDILKACSALEPAAFCGKLSSLGNALKRFDQFDEGVNTIFALFDQLIQLSVSDRLARNSSLTLTAELGGKTVTQMYASGMREPD